MKTYLDENEFEYSEENYSYQHDLTLKLDSTHDERATQELINEIVLWKVNRYVKMRQETLDLLNSDKIKGHTIDENFTRELLQQLLTTKGIRLALASTILRFRNPNVYQIIDQRAYRFADLGELKVSANIDEQIDLYLNYLRHLKKISSEKGFEFAIADRIFYQYDKVENKSEKIKY